MQLFHNGTFADINRDRERGTLLLQLLLFPVLSLDNDEGILCGFGIANSAILNTEFISV